MNNHLTSGYLYSWDIFALWLCMSVMESRDLVSVKTRFFESRSQMSQVSSRSRRISVSVSSSGQSTLGTCQE